MNDGASAGVHVSAGSGDAVPNPVGGPLTFKLRAADTGGALTAFESTAAPGEGPPLHTHDAAGELIYFLEGTFRVILDGELQEAPAGSMTFIRRGTPHTWQNSGETPAKLLALFTPASTGMESFFEQFAGLSADAAPSAFETIGREAGMEVLGPPLAISHPL